LVHLRDSIIGYWEALRENNAERFDKEAETLIVLPSGNWQNPLYGHLCHAIELTAVQRAIKRWGG